MTSKVRAWVTALSVFGFAACSILPTYIDAAPISAKIGHARLLLRLSPDPPSAGAEMATLEVRGVPAGSLSNTEVTFTTAMTQMGMSGSSGTAKPVIGHAGEWTFDVRLGMSGTWNITVAFAGPPGGSATFNFNVVSQSSSGSGTPLVTDDGLGHVRMATLCQDAVQHDFDRGLAMLYSFWYDFALKTFNDVIARDPNFAIAYWGVAMTYKHPLWGPPTGIDLKTGISYLDAASMQYETLRALKSRDDALAKQRRDELVAFAKRYAGSRMSSFVQRLATKTDGLYQIQSGNTVAGMQLLADAASSEAADEVVQPLIGLPAQELYGRELLLHRNYARAESELNRALLMTPNRPKALLWLAEAARRNGDRATAVSAEQRFKAVWSADSLAATDAVR